MLWVLIQIALVSRLMRLWYLSHRWPAKAQVSLRVCAVSSEPSLFTHMKYRSRRRVRPKIRHLAPLDGSACAFEEWVFLLRTKSAIISWDGLYVFIAKYRKLSLNYHQIPILSVCLLTNLLRTCPSWTVHQLQIDILDLLYRTDQWSAPSQIFGDKTLVSALFWIVIPEL